MLRLLADANFNGDIVRGLLRIEPSFEIVRVQDTGLADADDPEILSWSADHNWIFLRTTAPRCRITPSQEWHRAK
jgi:hypothetical protein